MSTPCSCGSQKPASDCCGAILSGARKPATAEELMRARYAAYAAVDLDFLYNSSAPAVQQDFDREASRRWAEGSTWTGMEIVAKEKGEAEDDEGIVEFIAYYTVDGTDFEHHERALFQRLDGEWKFVDGVLVNPQPYVREEPKVGRNDPCPCGSGKKYKKCCGK